MFSSVLGIQVYQMFNTKTTQALVVNQNSCIVPLGFLKFFYNIELQDLKLISYIIRFLFILVLVLNPT